MMRHVLARRLLGCAVLLSMLAFGPLYLPHRGVFVATWGRPWMDAAGLQATLGSLARLRAYLDGLRGAR